MHKNKLKMGKSPKCKANTLKLLLENKIDGRVSDINHSNIFDPSLKVKEIKAKISKWDLIKLKSFCTAKETIDKTKR